SGGPFGATRMYPILAFEYAVSGYRTSAGVAVAMVAAPIMLGLSLVLARYMLWRDDLQGGTRQDGLVWQTVIWLLWPVRAVLGILLGLFWLVNDLAERAVETAGRTVFP